MWSHVPNKRRLWNVFSPKMCFRRFWAFDLTLSATGWPRTLSLYTNRFVSWRAARSFLPQSSRSIRGETTRGFVPTPSPRCPWKWPKWPCHWGLAQIRPESIPESESESESIPEGRSRSRSRSHLESHRLRSPGYERVKQKNVIFRENLTFDLT